MDRLAGIDAARYRNYAVELGRIEGIQQASEGIASFSDLASWIG